MLDFLRHKMTNLAGFLATLAVGAWVATDQATDGGVVEAGAVWWVPYGVFVATFAYDAFRSQPGRWNRTLVAVETITASLTYLVDPSLGWTGILVVVSASSGAMELTRGWLAVQVGVQTAVAGVGQLAAGNTVADALLAAVAFGAFQMFAVLVVRAQRREAEARSALAEANVDLRATSGMLAQSTQLSERMRIARELHDLIGHQLTALSIELEVASHKSAGEGRLHVEKARDTARELLGDVRAVVGDLRAPQTGLAEPLEAIVDGLPGLEVDLRVREEAAVPEETAMTVIRCVQEVVTNVLRHSKANRLVIEVHSNPEGVTVRAEDDGQGIERVAEGHGLTGMRERVERLGGELAVDGRPGLGLRLAASIPSR